MKRSSRPAGMLLGFVMIYSQTGSFDLAAIKSYYAGHALPGLAGGWRTARGSLALCHASLVPAGGI